LIMKNNLTHVTPTKIVTTQLKNWNDIESRLQTSKAKYH